MSSREDLIEQMVLAVVPSPSLDEERERLGRFEADIAEAARIMARFELTPDAETMLPVVVRHITNQIRGRHKGFSFSSSSSHDLCLECSDHENTSWPCEWIRWADELDAEMGVTR